MDETIRDEDSTQENVQRVYLLMMVLMLVMRSLAHEALLGDGGMAGSAGSVGGACLVRHCGMCHLYIRLLLGFDESGKAHVILSLYTVQSISRSWQGERGRYTEE